MAVQEDEHLDFGVWWEILGLLLLEPLGVPPDLLCYFLSRYTDSLQATNLGGLLCEGNKGWRMRALNFVFLF